MEMSEWTSERVDIKWNGVSEHKQIVECKWKEGRGRGVSGERALPV